MAPPSPKSVGTVDAQSGVATGGQIGKKLPTASALHQAFRIAFPVKNLRPGSPLDSAQTLKKKAPPSPKSIGTVDAQSGVAPGGHIA